MSTLQYESKYSQDYLEVLLLVPSPCAIDWIQAAPSVVSVPTYDKCAAEMMKSKSQTWSPVAQKVLTFDSG